MKRNEWGIVAIILFISSFILFLFLLNESVEYTKYIDREQYSIFFNRYPISVIFFIILFSGCIYCFYKFCIFNKKIFDNETKILEEYEKRNKEK
jgi:magnesium-transporting ATPase (P-type)